MVINALNSGARGFMADFEDSNSPNWRNMIEGQVNLTDAINGSIEHDEKGKHYELDDGPRRAPRPPPRPPPARGHLHIDDEPVAGAFMDFGLYVHRNAEALLERGWGPYLYIPKLESQHEAALWRDAFVIAEEALGLDRGTIKATVLIETIPAAFCMDAILYELRDHAAGLNAGRWDYIFSAIKRFRSRPEFVTPDRSEVTMTVPFMKAYSDLVVKTCHARGAHAMGGMAAVIPSRTDEEANSKAFESVKARQGARGGRRLRRHLGRAPGFRAGRDGGVRRGARRAAEPGRASSATTWSRRRRRCSTWHRPPASAPRRGSAPTSTSGIQYISSWLRGNGAAGIYGLMEDAATAEIARGQVWQWIRHEATLDDGRTITPELVRELATSELERIRSEIGDDEWFERGGPARPVTLALRARRAERRLRGVPDAAGVRRAAEARARLGRFLFPGPLGVAELAQRALALVARRAVQDEDAVQVVHLVLDHPGLEARCLDQARLALLVERAHAHVHRALHVDDDPGDREAALVERLLSRSTTRARGSPARSPARRVPPGRRAAAARCRAAAPRGPRRTRRP